MRIELEELEAKKKDLKTALASRGERKVHLHPNLAGVYRKRIEDLRSALNEEDSRTEAAAILRNLVEEIRLVPKGKELRIHLVGKLSELIAAGQKQLQPGLEAGLQLTLVAGIGFEPMTFRL